ncbi:MAG: ATP-dependent RNA helicase HrpA [Pseudomonadota bacterium]
MESNKSNQINLENLKQRLQQACSKDYYSLNAKLNKLSHKDKKELNSIAKKIESSIQARKLRTNNIPMINCDERLPIYAKKSEFQTKLASHQVLIVCGETGSGKTTQLPLYCLESGRGIGGLIGHTQPRRIAARTVAKRIADQLDTTLGNMVGYKIRHQDQTGDQTYIKLMTDGVLLNEMQRDKFLNQYDTIIIDEAHERSLNIDFILGYIKQLLPKRPDLKVIVTSATIDIKKFSSYFDDAPVIEVSGKTFPVEVLYRPIEEEDNEARLKAIYESIRELSNIDMGDILIFLEGEGEIHETDKFLKKQKLADTDILPLYARLSSSRQGKIFSPHKRRHVILATNVAETSLTIPGIRYVIDTGKARISRYSVKSKVQRLPVEKISQAAADQRKGRCGRTSEGICIRLYNQDDFDARQAYTQPEILRTNLASVILQMKVLNLGDIQRFPFLEPPDDKLINDGINVLKEINALSPNGRLTKSGRKIARMPIEPRFACMLLAAKEYQCITEMLIIVSALSIQDPRERPFDNMHKADKAHEQFKDKESDFIWFINLWQFYHLQMQQLSQNKLKKLCATNFLSYMRMREWIDIHRQLRHVCSDLKLALNKEPANYQSIHCAILTGLASQVAYHSEKHIYSGARNIQTYLFPASTLFDKKPEWIVAAELVETTRLYARNIARVESKWIIKTAKHLLKYQYGNIQWEAETGRVIASESTFLFGMLLSANRIINYSKINAVEARKLFIQYALIDNQLNNDANFIKHNRELIDEVREMEIKTRRPDILDESAIYQFYDD